MLLRNSAFVTADMILLCTKISCHNWLFLLPLYRKMFIFVTVQCLPCPIWPVELLNPNYTAFILWLLCSVTVSSHSTLRISCPFFCYIHRSKGSFQGQAWRLLREYALQTLANCTHVLYKDRRRGKIWIGVTQLFQNKEEIVRRIW
jgi:hypothetical protein